jgi:hypothetical protein
MMFAEAALREGTVLPHGVAQTSSLAFLHERADQSWRSFAPEEQRLLDLARHALRQADSVVICLGGRAGRLGECLVGTALLEGVLLALRRVGNASASVHLLVDQGAVDLFDERLYQEHRWPHMRVHTAPVAEMSSRVETLLQHIGARQNLVVDLHGAHDDMPSLRVEQRCLAFTSDASFQAVQTVTTLGCLFRVGVRSFAQRGTRRRYADFIEALFALPAGALDGALTQPRIWLSADDQARYPALTEEYGLRASSLLIVCFFQSIVPAKCYGRWSEALALLCQQVARCFPQQTLDFLMACGPDEDLPEGVRLADVAEEFEDFTGTRQNARVVVRATPALRDLAIIVRHAALVLSNDTGPGHLAGALRVPTIVPYLPGHVYSKAVWASSPWHHGVTLEPNPFTRQQIEAAVLWDSTEIIDSVPAERLVMEAFDQITNDLLSGGYRTPPASATPDDRGCSTTPVRCQPRHQER